MEPIMKDEKTKLTLTVNQLSKSLSLSRGSTYEAIRRGEIPHIRIGRRILIPKAAFERFLESCNQNAAKS